MCVWGFSLWILIKFHNAHLVTKDLMTSTTINNIVYSAETTSKQCIMGMMFEMTVLDTSCILIQLTFRIRSGVRTLIDFSKPALTRGMNTEY